MQRFRAMMTAACLAAGLGLGLGVSAASANEDVKPEDAVQIGSVPTSQSQAALQPAAYDVILIPRAGGSPRVLTERGWRSLSQQRPRPRAWSGRPAYTPRAYTQPGYSPPAFNRPSYETRPYSRWASRYDYRDAWPSDPSRWTRYSDQRQSGQRQRF